MVDVNDGQPRASAPPRGWRWRRPRRRHLLVALVLLVVGGALAWVFRPSVQRAFLLERLAPVVDSVTLDYVRLTPWSAHVEGLDLRAGGGHYRVAELDLGFNPLGLFAHTVSIRHLKLLGADLDLRGLPPDDGGNDAPFPGVLAAMNHGYALRLGALDAALHLDLAGDRALDVVLDGGGFAPLRAGTLNAMLTFLPAPDATPLSANLRLGVTQINRGRVRALVADAESQLALPAPANEQRLGLTLTITPPPTEDDEDAPPPTAIAPDGTVRILPAPEDIKLVARLGNADPATLDVVGTYQGADGSYQGHYHLADVASLLQNLAGTTLLPRLDTDTRGRLRLDAVHGTGEVTLAAQTRIGALSRVLGDNPELPEYLDLTVDAAANFGPTHARFEHLSASLMDAEGTPRLLAMSAAPLEIDVAAPLAVLDTPRELLRLALGPVPLQWLEGLSGGRMLEGELLGPFVLRVDEQKRFRLEALAPTTVLDVRVTDTEAKVAPEPDAAVAAADVVVEPDPTDAPAAAPEEAAATPPSTSTATASPVRGAVLVANLDLRVSPSASWSEDFVRYALNDLRVTIADAPLVTLDLKAASKQDGEPVRTWRYRLATKIEYDTLQHVPAVAPLLAAWPLPPALSLNLKGLVSQKAEWLSVEKADAEVNSANQPRLVALNALRPFHFELGDTPRLNNPTGELATIATRGLDLAWGNPFLDGIVLRGRLASADFRIQAPTAGTLALGAAGPLVLDGFGVNQGGTVLARGLALRVSPDLRYAPGASEVALRSLTLRSGGGRLVSGDLTLGVTSAPDQPPAFTARGKLALDVSRLASQPALADTLGDALPDAVPLAARLDFDLASAGEKIDVARAHAELDAGPRARFVLNAKPGLEIRTRLAPGEELARHVVGQAGLDVRNLSSETLNHFVPLGPVSFAEINSSLRLRSNGSILRAATLAPLAVEAVRVNDAGHELLKEFSLSTNATLRAEGHELKANFKDLALAFSADPQRPALRGSVALHVDPDNQVPLTTLDARLTADLPQILSQPAVLPGHKLTGGALALSVAVDPARHIQAKALLDGLTSTAPLAIETFELPVEGEMASDGQGFDFTAPLIGRGKSGVSNATVVGHYAPQPDEPRVLRLDIASKLFYLNDILATVQQVTRGEVTPPPSAETAGEAPKTPPRIVVDDTPDTKAAWKLLPYAVVVDLQIDKLFYTDYLAFTDVGGQLDLRTRKFALNGIKAHFHEAALKLDGITRFDATAAQPYSMEIGGTINDFDLNQFFTELVPGEKPRVEGLFGVEVKGFGQFPNFGQLRNRLLFDIRMQSRDGLFRPLPPGSGLLVGASDVLGFVGEGLSYIPTGGFGAGAIARLVNYIARIDYDSIDIHLKRDESRNVTVEQFQLLSPTIALTATGGIQHEEGSDIFDSPLELTAHLDMLGRGAAILYSMDLMQDERNELGYWRGPEIRIWGTPADSHSNFEEVINQAADGTTKGAFTRPIAGIIGNLKYRWFDSDSRKREAQTESKREERIEQLEAEAPAETAH